MLEISMSNLVNTVAKLSLKTTVLDLLGTDGWCTFGVICSEKTQ